MIGAKIVRICVNETGVIKNGAAHFRNDWEGVSDGDTGERLPTDWLAVIILWTDIAKVKPAQVIRAAEKQTVKNKHLVTIAPGIDSSDFAIQNQDGVISGAENSARQPGRSCRLGCCHQESRRRSAE